MMDSRSRIPTAMALILGILMGWGLASFRPAPYRPAPATARASRSWRPDRCWCASTRLPRARWRSMPSTVLDYKGGRLLATVPSYRQTNTSTRLIEPFSERDLVADFKLDLDTGPRPRFLMTTGSIGPDSAGWAPLYVFETTTSQVAVYRMLVQQTIGKASRPRFELLELRSYAKAGAPTARP